MARDIIINILGYRDLNSANWWKTIKLDEKYVITHNKKYHFTLEGLKFAECKQVVRNKKIVESNSGVYIIQYPWNIQKIKIGWSNDIFARYKNYNTVFCGEQKLLLHI